MRSIGRWVACAAMSACTAFAAGPAQDPARLVHLLDYIAVDYPEAVAGGKVKNDDEYREMTEFSATVAEGIARLEPTPAKAALESAGAALRKSVADKASPQEVAARASALRRAMIDAYRVAIGPGMAPDLRRAALLFAEHCAGCHGAAGTGDGPLARGLDPQPSNFHDGTRQALRSVHGLYNTITLGVTGTAMRGFAELPSQDRWALAYLAANWGASAETVARGKTLWNTGKMRGEFTRQASIAGSSASEIRSRAGEDTAAVAAYLRTEPSLIDAGKSKPIEFARAKMAESVAAYARGERAAAHEAALAAYLEGFELVEAGLAAVDETLMRVIEGRMIDYRNAVKSGAPLGEVEGLARRIDDSLHEGGRRLDAGGLSAPAAFAASFVILFREGLEAVLVVAALAAFLRRGNQRHALPYLHMGWIAALAAGALTWLAAASLIAVSGASREVTEGMTGLVAAAMLLYVGFWLHDKSHARAWNEFVLRGARAVRPGAAWGLAVMAFVAVYREVFETILFYEALWAQSEGRALPILAGVAAALVLLAASAWALLRYSVRLPLGLFFGASGILLAVIAVVLAGNGVASLQEAGWLPITPVPFVTVRWLGIHPNAQALGLQLLLAALVFVLLRASARKTSAMT